MLSCKVIRWSAFTWRSQTSWSGIVLLFALLVVQQVGPQGRFTLTEKTQRCHYLCSVGVEDRSGVWTLERFVSLTCLTCSPWLQILSSKSQRLAIRVFSSTPVMLTSPWPNSTASRPIFSTSIRFVCTDRDRLTHKQSSHPKQIKLNVQCFILSCLQTS